MRYSPVFAATLRSLGYRTLTGATVLLLGAHAFCQNAPATRQPGPILMAPPQAIALSTGSAPKSVLIADDENIAPLPEAPVPESSSATAAATTIPTETRRHKMRPGFLVLGIAGAAAAGMGAYIFSINTSRTGARDLLGTMFLAPGAAAAAVGFYFAFRK